MRYLYSIKLITLFIFTLSNNPFFAQLTQLGENIPGQLSDAFFGSSICLDSIGTTIAVGGHNHNAGAGYVETYTWNGSTWIQKGSSINGATPGEQFGRSVALSANGNILAVGSNYATTNNGSYSGKVKIYQWANNSWNQLGTTIDGLYNYDQDGTSVSLSSDGKTVAIGASNHNGTGSGHARVFSWDGTTWNSKGTMIVGVTPGEMAGSSVKLSSDGNTIVIGAPGAGANWSFTGKIRVYDWSGSTWVMRGFEIMGENPEDQLGQSVSISYDGNMIIGGAIHNNQNTGHARVYEWSGTSWTQKGMDLDGISIDSWTGYAVEMSGNGNTVVVGSIRSDVNSADEGQIYIYDWNGSLWEKREMDINGQNEGDMLGYAVGISADGNTIASGIINYDVLGVNTGAAAIYRYCHVDTGINQNEITLTANADFATYQWINCADNSTIDGATSKSYIPTENGSYAVVITQGECMDTSNCVTISTVGLKQKNEENNFIVYPNPTNNNFKIDLGRSFEIAEVSLFNQIGQKVYSEIIYQNSNIEVKEFIPAGIYNLEIKTTQFEKTIVKLIITE